MAKSSKYPLLLAYINSLSPSERDSYAARCGTTVGYLRKQVSARGNFGMELAALLSQESGGRVPLSEVGANFDWARFRASLMSVTPRKVG